MNKQEWLDFAATAVEHYNNLSKAADAATEAGCLVEEGALYKAMWNAFDALLDVIDEDGWIQWFIYDNDCGANGYFAVGGKSKRKITTLKQLAELLVKIGYIEP
jgi:hypothetical protein